MACKSVWRLVRCLMSKQLLREKENLAEKWTSWSADYGTAG